MLRSIKDLEKYDVLTKDGDIGRLRSFLFEEEQMKVKFLLINTEKWLPGRRVVISPEKVVTPIESHTKMVLDLSKKELEMSPTASEHRPVSEEKREVLLRGMLPSVLWYPVGIEPGMAVYAGRIKIGGSETGKEEDEERLRSTKHIEGYTVHATNGNVGHVEDFIVDTKDWRIRYLVVDTRALLPGGKVIISPDWVRDFQWEAKHVMVNHSIEEVKGSPKFDPMDPVNRKYETVLYDYYGRPYYWET